jgi:RimJ/RimL family protein N-acetyltransferase
MDTNHTIRQATPDDAVATLEFLTVFREEGLPTVLKRDGVPEVGWQVEFIGKMDGDEGVMLIVEEAGKVIGMLTAHRHGQPQLRHSCEFGMSVLAAHRGRGLGTQLIQALFDWAESVGIRRVELSVFSNNPGAQRLYERMGFMAEGRKQRAIEIDGVFFDIIQMVRMIESPPAYVAAAL